jgi:hypothetical protein
MGKHDLCFTNQVCVYLCNGFARLAFTVDECDLCLRVMQQQPYHFPAGITCAAYNACFNQLFVVY